MNNLDAILKSIDQDGEKEGEKIVAQARLSAEKESEEAERRAREEYQRIIEKAKDEADRLLKNSEVSSQRQARDIEIRALNKLISETLEASKEELKKISKKDYRTYVLKSLEGLDREGGEILLQEGYEDAFKKGDLEGLKISKDLAPDGFILRRGQIDYDNTFSSILDYNSDEYKEMIIKELNK